MTTVRFGTDGEIALANEGAITSPVVPTGEPLEDVLDAVVEALRSPLEFPPLDRIILAGDSVAIPLQPGIPCAQDLLAGAVMAVMAVGVPAEMITIVRAAEDTAISSEKLLDSLDPQVASQLSIVQHDPEDREQLCFLGASRDGHAIYINRHLADASVVLPIGLLSSDGSVHDGWYPIFADKEAMGRTSVSNDWQENSDEIPSISEVDEAGWMLGVQFVLQLIPAGNGRAMHVLAGLSKTVWEQGSELLRKAWDVEFDETYDLIIAGIGGGPEQQTWNNVIHTITQLAPAIHSDGAIAICSELSTKPSSDLRGLRHEDDFESGQHDSPMATRLSRAVSQVRVYMLSNLDENDVEDLGIAFVSSPREVVRLASHFDKCMAIENAQHINIKRKQPVD